MSMVKKDRAGPQLLADVAPSARTRWGNAEYRPRTLTRVSADLDKCRSGGGTGFDLDEVA
jgi:hypothetical protein